MENTNKVTFKVKIFTSKKGNKAFALCACLGYRDAFVSFDQNVISEILHVSLVDLFDKPIGEYPIA